ncbi:hypothetical protein LTR84_010583 [Exophiala bonariae]|uniref:Uncharacterized protein n=1 Tax=Exophiala bonariae TaxID=1690606 RepID=A0AAV9MSU4_9EURO|nr:hypothetical protein LTR84_010583 [Exophiala bonariae]
MQLMQKYAKDDGTIGIDNLNRWSESSEPVKFLLMTNTTTSIQELMQHAFLKLPWRKEELELLHELASFCRRAYKYHE